MPRNKCSICWKPVSQRSQENGKDRMCRQCVIDLYGGGSSSVRDFWFASMPVLVIGIVGPIVFTAAAVAILRTFF